MGIGELILGSSPMNMKVEYGITDIQGREICPDGAQNNFELDLSSQSNDLYVLRAYIHGQSHTGKIVVKR